MSSMIEILIHVIESVINKYYVINDVIILFCVIDEIICIAENCLCRGCDTMNFINFFQYYTLIGLFQIIF